MTKLPKESLLNNIKLKSVLDKDKDFMNVMQILSNAEYNVGAETISYDISAFRTPTLSTNIYNWLFSDNEVTLPLSKENSVLAQTFETLEAFKKNPHNLEKDQIDYINSFLDKKYNDYKLGDIIMESIKDIARKEEQIDKYKEFFDEKYYTITREDLITAIKKIGHENDLQNALENGLFDNSSNLMKGYFKSNKYEESNSDFEYIFQWVKNEATLGRSADEAIANLNNLEYNQSKVLEEANNSLLSVNNNNEVETVPENNNIKPPAEIKRKKTTDELSLSYVVIREVELLQIEYNKTHGDKFGIIKVDGKLGPETTRALINSELGEELITNLLKEDIDKIKYAAENNNHDFFKSINNEDKYKDNIKNNTPMIISIIESKNNSITSNYTSPPQKNLKNPSIVIS